MPDGPKEGEGSTPVPMPSLPACAEHNSGVKEHVCPQCSSRATSPVSPAVNSSQEHHYWEPAPWRAMQFSQTHRVYTLSSTVHFSKYPGPALSHPLACQGSHSHKSGEFSGESPSAQGLTSLSPRETRWDSMLQFLSAVFLDQNQRNIIQDHVPAPNHHEAQSLSSDVFVPFPTAFPPFLKKHISVNICAKGLP